jgi:hypothetical protein
MTISLLIVALVGAIGFGFLAGFLTFKRSLRWCQVCGSYLQCPDCLRRAQSTHAGAVEANRASAKGVRR